MSTAQQLGEAPAHSRELSAECREEEVELLIECLGSSGKLTRTKAITLVERFGSLSGALSASKEAISSTPGLTSSDAAALRSAHRLAMRVIAFEDMSRTVISSWQALLAYVRLALRHERREQFRVLFLNTRNYLIRDEVLGFGSVDHAPVYPREVMRRALELSASNLILVHNHPSGDPSPSPADRQITKQVVDAGRALGIRVHDHLIVGGVEVASFRALGLMLEP